MKRVLLVCDRPNWAYEAIAQALVKHNTESELFMDIFYLKGKETELNRVSRPFDLLFVLGWQLLAEFKNGKLAERFPFLESARTITGIHSHHSWDGRATQPGKRVEPPAVLVEFLRRYRGVNAVSTRLADLFSKAGLERVICTPNGVDIEMFRPMEPLREKGSLRVGFSGNKKHDWRKGISAIIEPACDLPDVELSLAMWADDQYVPHSQMYKFYNKTDIYLCASTSEGFSLSVLEASACGRPVISTRVGGCEELISDGVNGFLVDRDVESIREKIRYFLADRKRVHEMGQANRRIVEEHWSWEKRAPAWLQFIKDHLL